MSILRSSQILSTVLAVTLLGCGEQPEPQSALFGALEASPNPAGTAESFHTTGVIDRTNPFFQRLGINDRTCETCHRADQGWAITASGTKALFEATAGLAAIFNPLDEGARPDADVSTVEARRATYDKTLLRLALTRFPQTVPATGEFTIIAVDDPAGFATPALATRFRRPTATANEAKVSSTNWTAGPHDVPTNLLNTVSGAARFHAQRPDAVPAAQAAAARDFQLGLFFAQTVDRVAGRLDVAGAKGGPVHLAAQPFYVGINDMQGNDPTGRPFSRKVFDLFDAWSVFNTGSSGSGSGSSGSGSSGSGSSGSGSGGGDDVRRARGAIYRGQEIFNFHEFNISGVRGINDVFGQETVRGTCSTCHNVPNVGGHAVFRMFDIGAADEDNCSSDLPLLTLQHKVTGETRRVCDMGRGGNGTWADVGAFRAPPLRGLAARAPFFHDGKARDIKEVVEFYHHRFDLNLSGSQRDDLVAFLGAL